MPLVILDGVGCRTGTSRSTTTARKGQGQRRCHAVITFSADETTDIGYESGTPVSPAYTTAASTFTGQIHQFHKEHHYVESIG